MPRRLYYAITDGIRVTVEPRFVAEQSRPSMGHYVFAYRVRLENVGERAAQLLARRWLIHDDIGHDSEVAGEGVVGEQPMLLPGSVYTYQSSAVLRASSGWMEGEYHLVRPDGESFDATIPRFYLTADEVATN
ncbi:MAG: Co2+/Mg2+ efflux protein ApaG [Gemmatimonadetes bacterium]|nr:Co2+/Mg2+ efflux protein ApaG [Gemmatimonadota bacterium]